MDDTFFNAFLPPTAKIAGKKLSKFTLWHYFLLSAINSPVIAGRSFGITDLIAAVKCCTHNYGNPVDMSPSLRDVWWSYKYKKQPYKFKQQGLLFYKWINTQSIGPKFWRLPSNVTTTNKKLDNGPRCLAIACSLMNRAGFSCADAWNTSLGQAQWMEAQMAKLEGAEINFMSENDIQEKTNPFDQMTPEQVLETMRKELPTEEMAMKSFEHWKNHRN